MASSIEPAPYQSAHPAVPQPQTETTAETPSPVQEWTVISTEQGVTISILEAEGLVTSIRLDWSAQSELAPEDTDTEHFANEVLVNWNPVPGRQFQLDEDAWTEADYDQGLRFETAVVTTFRTVVELYLDTSHAVQEDELVKAIVGLLSQKLPELGVAYTRLFGCVMQVELSPYASVERTRVEKGEYALETDDGWASLPPYRVPVPLESLEPILGAFERQLTQQVMPHDWKGHAAWLDLKKVYGEIAKGWGVNLTEVNTRRGKYLPDAYVQGEPEPPETEADKP